MFALTRGPGLQQFEFALEIAVVFNTTPILPVLLPAMMILARNPQRASLHLLDEGTAGSYRVRVLHPGANGCLGGGIASRSAEAPTHSCLGEATLGNDADDDSDKRVLDACCA